MYASGLICALQSGHWVLITTISLPRDRDNQKVSYSFPGTKKVPSDSTSIASRFCSTEYQEARGFP